MTQNQNRSQTAGLSDVFQNDSEKDLYLESYMYTTAAALVGSIDKIVTVTLREGRVFIGILRTFDQFANLVLQDTVERVYIGDDKYAEAPQGVFLIRGENVSLVGEIDLDQQDKDLEKRTQIPFPEAQRIRKELVAAKQAKTTKERELMLSKGFEPQS
ncbi:hypothetical protein LJB42_002846 [Komagataella kurtzmanii]|nr:hypothetical protein LJB42_002846 [Komagataella kurtzmanii]